MAFNLTAKSLCSKSHSKVYAAAQRYLKAHGIEYSIKSPWDPATDMSVALHGEYAGMYLQIGDGYITVCADIKEEVFFFHDVDERVTLNDALRACLTEYKSELKKNLP